MQQVTLSGTRAFATLPGLPSLYGNFAFDADHANIDEVRAGVQSFVWQPRLLINFESGYYKPQDNGDVVIQNINRREDPIFQLFSVSDELQFRGGAALQPDAHRVDLRRPLLPALRAARRARTSTATSGAPACSTCPAATASRRCALEYYGIDSGGGSVNGGKLALREPRLREHPVPRQLQRRLLRQERPTRSGTAIAQPDRRRLHVPSRAGRRGELRGQPQPVLSRRTSASASSSATAAATARAAACIANAVGNHGGRGRGRRRSSARRRGAPAPATWSADPSLPASGWAASTFAAAEAASDERAGAPRRRRDGGGAAAGAAATEGARREAARRAP